ncbi:MAG: hypothetical protein JNL83_08760 [Myxococcales bacterium]|nr:hypothetical protein [Myxococcales bacterium]
MRSIGLLLTLMVMLCACTKGGTPATKTGQAGSGSNGLPPPPPPGQQGPTCESAITHSMALAIQAAPEAERDALKTKMDAAKTTMIAACHEDAWSAALLECLDKARDDASTGACYDLLTPAQQDGVKRRLDATP